MGGAEKGNTVQNPQIEHPTQNRVMAVFEASAAFFELPRAATREDLAGRLAHLSERHDGALMSVDVRVGSGGAKRRPSLRVGAPVGTPPAAGTRRD